MRPVAHEDAHEDGGRLVARFGLLSATFSTSWQAEQSATWGFTCTWWPRGCRAFSCACETPDGRTGFGSALATKSKKSQKRRRNPLGSPAPALLEGDPSFARGFGETNRARGGPGNWDVSRETSVLLLLMFHVKHSALPRTGEEGRGFPSLCACGGACFVGGASAGAIGGCASRT